MTAQLAYARPRVKVPPVQRVDVPSAKWSGCIGCPARELNFCRALAKAADLPRPYRQRPVQEFHTVLSRRIICRERDVLAGVPIICDGWAAAAVILSDGSRQILSFLLPGDVISAALLFDSKPDCFVEAITDVTYRAFDRTDLFQKTLGRPGMLEKLARVWIDEKRRADDLIIDLGCRPAAERIARLILSLVERLQRRGMTNGGPFDVDFPLRQHHIADAVGLTPVHVSKLLSDFRRNGLIRLSERSLVVLDLPRLRAVANMRCGVSGR